MSKIIMNEPSAFVLKCKLPAKADGYDTSGCDTLYTALSVPDCVVRCGVGFVGNATGSCSSAGEEFAFGGCTQGKCADFGGITHPSGTACCSEACGALCGAAGCASGEQNASLCCAAHIHEACTPSRGAPCRMSAAPAPAPPTTSPTLLPSEPPTRPPTTPRPTATPPRAAVRVAQGRRSAWETTSMPAEGWPSAFEQMVGHIVFTRFSCAEVAEEVSEIEETLSSGMQGGVALIACVPLPEALARNGPAVRLDLAIIPFEINNSSSIIERFQHRVAMLANWLIQQDGAHGVWHIASLDYWRATDVLETLPAATGHWRAPAWAAVARGAAAAAPPQSTPAEVGATCGKAVAAWYANASEAGCEGLASVGDAAHVCARFAQGTSKESARAAAAAAAYSADYFGCVGADKWNAVGFAAASAALEFATMDTAKMLGAEKMVAEAAASSLIAAGVHLGDAALAAGDAAGHLCVGIGKSTSSCAAAAAFLAAAALMERAGDSEHAARVAGYVAAKVASAAPTHWMAPTEIALSAASAVVAANGSGALVSLVASDVVIVAALAKRGLKELPGRGIAEPDTNVVSRHNVSQVARLAAGLAAGEWKQLTSSFGGIEKVACNAAAAAGCSILGHGLLGCAAQNCSQAVTEALKKQGKYIEVVAAAAAASAYNKTLEDPYLFPTPSPTLPPSLTTAFVCSEDFDHWDHSWSSEKKAYCCVVGFCCCPSNVTSSTEVWDWYNAALDEGEDTSQ